MIHVDLDAPLRSLLDAGAADGRTLSQGALGRFRKPPVLQGVVGQAILSRDRIKLVTLAAYARAAGWRLWLETWRGGKRVGSARIDDLDVTVAGARVLLAALGLEMTLAVEPVEEKR